MGFQRLFFIGSLVLASRAAADFSCASDLNYQWKVIATSVVKTAPAPAKPGAPQAAPAPAEGAPADAVPSENTVFWSSIEATADTEENAKVQLADKINKERSRADGACRDAHENQTKCVSGKYSQNASVMSTMSFSQRKEFEKIIAADCVETAGRCLGSKATEAKCRELKKADDAAAAKDAGADKKGKDAKKK